MAEPYEQVQRRRAEVVFPFGDGHGSGVWIYVDRNGIAVEAAVEDVSAGDAAFIGWDELERARQRAIELEEASSD